MNHSKKSSTLFLRKDIKTDIFKKTGLEKSLTAAPQLSEISQYSVNHVRGLFWLSSPVKPSDNCSPS